VLCTHLPAERARCAARVAVHRDEVGHHLCLCERIRCCSAELASREVGWCNLHPLEVLHLRCLRQHVGRAVVHKASPRAFHTPRALTSNDRKARLSAASCFRRRQSRSMARLSLKRTIGINSRGASVTRAPLCACLP
jgi:hypothetical protein